MNNFLTEAQELFNYTQNLRRDFHRFPELGFKEVRTAAIVANELRQLGLEVTTGIAETGVVALLEGARPGPTLLLRFDMDALPVTEETGAEYASQNPGCMHACGHDGHVAIGLTVARLLNTHRAELPGVVKLVFQPAEEGLGGAERMIAEGVLQNPAPDYTLALHLWNEEPLGWLGITPGPVMAGAEIFQVRILGRGGHGAAPNHAVDPVLASAQVITALQSIVSRNVSPLETAVVSVTKVRAGEAFNVIPHVAELSGTIRTFEEPVRKRVLHRFEQLVSGVAHAMGCKAEIDLKFLTPAVVNAHPLTRRVQTVAKELLPGHHLATSYRTMGSEDMSYMQQNIPGCFAFVGCANPEKGLDYPHHHPKFDFDERALPQAAALITTAAVDILTQ